MKKNVNKVSNEFEKLLNEEFQHKGDKAKAQEDANECKKEVESKSNDSRNDETTKKNDSKNRDDKK